MGTSSTSSSKKISKNTSKKKKTNLSLLPKKVDHTKLSKDVAGFRDRKRVFAVDDNKIDECIILPFDYTNPYTTKNFHRLLLEADVYVKQQKLKGKTCCILPSCVIGYVIHADDISSFESKQQLYLRYQEFFSHCQSLGVQLVFSWEAFFRLSTIETVQQRIKEYQEKGNIYDNYAVRYRSVEHQTILNPYNVIQKKEPGRVLLVRSFVEGKGYCLTFHLHYHYLLFGIVGFLVHPKDKRYKKMIGKKAIIPITNKAVPILADEEIDMHHEEGTWALTPGHNEKDLLKAQEHHLPTKVYSFNEQGKFTTEAKEFSHKDLIEFTNNIAHFLQDIGNIEDTYQTNIAYFYNKIDNTPVYPLANEQRFFTLSPHQEYPDIELAIQGDPKVSPKREEFFNPKQRGISKKTNGLEALPCVSMKENEHIKTVVFPSLQEYISTILSATPTPSQAREIYLYALFLKGYTQDGESLHEMFYYLTHTPSQNMPPLGQQILAHIMTFCDDKKFITLLQQVQNKCQEVIQESIEEKDFDAILALIEKVSWIHIKEDGTLHYKRKKFFEIKSSQDSYTIHNVDIAFHINNCLSSWIQDRNIQDITYFGNVGTNYLSLSLFHLLSIGQRSGHRMHHTIGQEDNHIIAPRFFEQRKTQYGPDALRLRTYTSGQDIHNTEVFEQASLYFQKIRNIVRFLQQHQKLSTKKRLLCLTTQAIPTATKEEDIRLLHKVHTAIEYVSKYEPGEIHKVHTYLHYTWYMTIGEVYLTFLKNNHTISSEEVLRYCVGKMLLCTSIFFPFIGQHLYYTIAQKSPFDLQIQQFTPPTKTDHQYGILLDIIGKWKEYYLNNHPRGKNIHLYLKANKSFLDGAQPYTTFITQVLPHSQIEFLNEAQEIPDECDYEDTLINVSFGLYISPDVSHQKVDIGALEQEKEEQQQFLQKIRSIMTCIQPHETELRHQYTQQAEKAKQRIKDLEYEIQKGKYL